MDSGGKERLHQFAELRLLLGLSLHPDSCWGHCDSDRDNRMLCHSEGDEESSDCGKVAQSPDFYQIFFFLPWLFYFTPPLTSFNYMEPETKNRHFYVPVYTHTAWSEPTCAES